MDPRQLEQDSGASLVLRSAVVCVALACACTGDSNEIGVAPLSGPFTELPTAFSEISSVVEIDDGRVLIAAMAQKALSIADFATGQTSQLGRNGSGPGEYASMNHLVRLGGDTTLIDDAANGRFGVLVGGTLAAVAIPRRDGAEFIMPRQADARGRLYSQEATAEKDSVAVLRWDPTRARLDTVSFLRNGRIAVRASGSGSEVALTANFPKHPEEDVWGVLGDGTVLIARVADYRVEVATFVGDSSGAATITRSSSRATRSWWSRLSFWARRKPQVHAVYGRRPTTSADGRLWVPRTPRNDDAPEEYDLFDSTGAFVKRVVLPPHCTYIGFGPQSIYIVRTTAAGDVLVRYPLP